MCLVLVFVGWVRPAQHGLIDLVEGRVSRPCTASIWRRLWSSPVSDKCHRNALIHWYLADWVATPEGKFLTGWTDEKWKQHVTKNESCLDCSCDARWLSSVKRQTLSQQELAKLGQQPRAAWYRVALARLDSVAHSTYRNSRIHRMNRA